MDWPNFVHVGLSFWFTNFTSVEFKFKLTFIGVCCCNAATKHSMVWIVMPTFYCNYFFAWHSGAPYTRGPPGLCLPCLPHCYATEYLSGRQMTNFAVAQKLLCRPWCSNSNNNYGQKFRYNYLELYQTAADSDIQSTINISYRYCVPCKPAIRISKHQVLADFFVHK